MQLNAVIKIAKAIIREHIPDAGKDLQMSSSKANDSELWDIKIHRNGEVLLSVLINDKTSEAKVIRP
jgi:hypothetical protein